MTGFRPSIVSTIYCVFFFQAEDGIRDLTVTGVQTCALPIYLLCDLHGPLPLLFVAAFAAPWCRYVQAALSGGLDERVGLAILEHLAHALGDLDRKSVV